MTDTSPEAVEKLARISKGPHSHRLKFWELNKISDTLRALSAENAAARKVITAANNSLHGSNNYFLSTDGGELNERHLSDPIERIKEQTRTLHAENTALKAQRDAAIKRANSQGGRYWEGRWRDTQAELDALKAQVVPKEEAWDALTHTPRKVQAELDRLAAENASLKAQVVSVQALVEVLRALIGNFDERNPMRTADFHNEDCGCIRCLFDSGKAALAAYEEMK